jgi:alkanesulfonate monooxygenase SsuD/methylene tetrahydromethanopterin reductase-like flavin-dependent oxidoreductase (luciferase family)
MAGRGSFIESFPLFGYDLADYDALFDEKLDLLLRIRESTRVTWSGRFRAPLNDLPVYPRPLQEPLPVWVAVGGHPESVVRAGRLGLPLALAIIGGEPRRFVPLVELYREAARRSGHDPATLKVSINSHGLIEDDSRRAADDAFAAYSYVMAKIGRERGWAPPTRAQFEAERGPLGANLIGTPEEVAAKIVYEHQLFGLDRFLIQMSVGTLPHEIVLRSIELFGTKVAPLVREAHPLRKSSVRLTATRE